MAAKHTMHNLVNPPAAVSRAAPNYVLDLTSWCVKSGSVQLPQTLLGRFSVGKVKAQSDAGELDLEFRAPRVLAGLGAYFERHGLRANDRIEFSFEGNSLRISCQQREKQHREANAVPPIQRQAPAGNGVPTLEQRGEAGKAEGPRRRASDWTEAVDREVAQSALRRRERAEEAANKGITVDRFGGPVEDLVPGHTQQPQRRQAPDPAPDPGSKATSRKITTVRIEGGVPVQPTPRVVRPKDASSAHQVWAHQQNAQWRSLDSLRASERGDASQDPAFSDTVVRAYRRSANGSRQQEPLTSRPPAEVHGRGDETTRAKSAPRLRPHDHAPSTTASGRNSEAAADLAPQPALGAAAFQATEHPQDRPRREAPAYEAAADGPSSDSVTTGRATDEQRYFGGEDEAEESVAKGPHRGVISRLGLRLGIGRERAAGAGAANAHDEAPLRGTHAAPPPLDVSSGTAPAYRQTPRAARPHGLAGPGTPLEGRNTAGSASPRARGPHQGPQTDAPAYRAQAAADVPAGPMPGVTGPRPEAAPERRSAPAAVATALQDALLDPEADEPRQTAEVAASPAPETPRAPAPTASVSEDAAFLRNYLLRPGTPAIVRSIDLAEKLGMSPERALRAMDRLSEERERFSRIRDGAYMVRQKSD